LKKKKGFTKVKREQQKKKDYMIASSHCTIAGKKIGLALWITMANSFLKTPSAPSTEKISFFKMKLFRDVQMLHDIKIIISMKKGCAN
jgi:hypothetical protein